MPRLTYRAAGVDIDEGDRLVELIRPYAESTTREGVLGGLGGFGGLFALAPGRYREPVLVSGTDGVGTKLEVASAVGKHDTIGIDLVAMCVNDVCTTGAEPLFFLDYYATGALRADDAAQVVAGIAEGCRQAGCALLGGETAEMPGFYPAGRYDLAGFAVGVVERSEILEGARVAPGDCVLGLSSTGLHANGYSLARRILFAGEPARALDERPPELSGRSVGEVLLAPTRIYARAIRALREAAPVRALAHVTGSGIPGNLPRVLPPGTRAVIRRGSWPVPPIFELLRRRGEVDEAEMARTFNMGVGLCAIVPPEDAGRGIAALAAIGEAAYRIGEIEAGAPGAEAEVVYRAPAS